MAKVIGKVKVYTVDDYQKKDGTFGCRITAFDDGGNVIVFYRPKTENPVKDTMYNQVYTVDRNFTAVVRYEKVQ